MEFFLQKDTVMDIKTDILTRLRAKKGEVERRYHVKRMGLFGSYSRGEQKAGSDIDILVDFHDGADLFDLAGLKNYLKRDPPDPRGCHPRPCSPG